MVVSGFGIYSMASKFGDLRNLLPSVTAYTMLMVGVLWDMTPVRKTGHGQLSRVGVPA